jgi:NAD(P)H dehydrogenase (quinone)
VRAGDLAADERVEVRHHPHPPSRCVGGAGAGPADLGWRHRLVTGAERTVARCRARGVHPGGERVGAGGAGGRQDHEGAGERVFAQFRHGRADYVGTASRPGLHTLFLVPVRFVIIGGGPAGNTAATVAASLGAEVTMIERDVVGGAAHLWDCIPSKAMIATGGELTELTRARTMGLKASGELDVGALRDRVAKIERQICESITGLLESQQVRLIRGTGRLTGPYTVAAETDDGTEEIEADAILVSTGSRPRVPDWACVDGERVLTTRQAYPPPEIPDHLVVIGSGVTGVEFTHMFSALGAEVTLVVSRQQVLPHKDPEVAAALEDEFLQRGVKLLKGARAEGIRRDGDTVVVACDDGRRAEGSHALLCIGSIPNSEWLGADLAGVEVARGGYIPGNRHCQTNIPHIYSAGDVSGRLPLSSVAAMQGRKIAEHVMGLTARAHRHLDYDKAASAIFTVPEIADVGMAEAEAFAAGRKLRVTKVPFSANPKSLINGDPRGFVKILSDPATGVVLGGSIVGQNAAELISVLAVAVTNGLKVADIVDSLLVHPALAESLAEAAY